MYSINHVSRPTCPSQTLRRARSTCSLIQRIVLTGEVHCQKLWVRQPHAGPVSVLRSVELTCPALSTLAIALTGIHRRSRPTGKLFGNKEMRILMLGLDAAGKTSQFTELRPTKRSVPLLTRQQIIHTLAHVTQLFCTNSS